MAIETHKSDINGQGIQYYEDGVHHGRSVLLIHGGIGDAKQNWYNMIPTLAEDYHILAPDLPGFGGSDNLPNHSDLSDITAWIIAFLELQGIDQVAVIGTGFGALIARLLAAQYPQSVAAIVLMNGGFVPAVPAWAKIAMGLPVVGTVFTNFLARIATSEDGLKDMIHHPEVITPELIENVNANISGYASLMRMTATQPLPTKNKPMVSTLILWGEADKSTSVVEGNKLKAFLGNVPFVEIEGCGHLPHIEESDIFEWQVKNFLAKNDPTKRSAIPGT